MANEFWEDEDDFSPEILAAFADYPAPSPSKGFTQRFWAQWEKRRGRYRGLIGMLRRLWEIEIEGVAVWRLAASTVSGGFFCTLLFGLFLGSAMPKAAVAPPPPAPPPAHEPIPSTAMSAFAFYHREWENDLTVPRTKPKAAPTRTEKAGGEFSWTGSNGHLA